MSPLPEASIRSAAIHEAGHAVTWWWLDRRRFLGHAIPFLNYVAVILASDDVLSGSRGNALPDNRGVCAGDPVMNPLVERAIVEHSPHLQTQARRQFMQKAAAADSVQVMAGPMAEYLARGEPLLDWQDWGSWIGDEAFTDGSEEGHDHWQIWQRVPFLGRRWRLHLCRAFETADHIVRHHQPHIEALATALLRDGKIDGEEVYQLFDAIGPAVRGGQ